MTNAGVECFLAVCRHKTGSAAAQSLFITQSSLSTRLKTLERELGGQLFHRKQGCREMTLTQAGKEFYTLALEYEALIDKMQHVCQNQTQLLRISSLNSLATYLLPQVYEQLLKEHPGTRLVLQDMKLPEVSNSIRNNETDLALTAGKVNDNSITQIPTFSEPLVLVRSRHATYQEPVIASQLPAQEEVFINWNSDYAKWHQQTFGDHQSQICVSIMAQLKQFMERERCWAIVPVSVADGLTKECGIRRLKTDMPLPSRCVSILIPTETPSTPLLNHFIDCLKRVVSSYNEITLTY